MNFLFSKLMLMSCDVCQDLQRTFLKGICDYFSFGFIRSRSDTLFPVEILDKDQSKWVSFESLMMQCHFVGAFTAFVFLFHAYQNLCPFWKDCKMPLWQLWLNSTRMKKNKVGLTLDIWVWMSLWYIFLSLEELYRKSDSAE